MFAIDVHQVDGELHKEGVDRFAGDDPETGAGLEMGMLQQAGAALLTGVGEVDGVAEYGTASLIARQNFQMVEL